MAPARVAAVLTALDRLTHDMWEFVFVTPAPARFHPGQFALLSVADIPGARAYSMSNLSNDDGEWRLIVKRKPGGTLTDYLFDTMRIGDGALLSGPYGIAHLRPDMRDVWCIAGGSGLSPALSVARGVLALADCEPARVELFYGGRGAADLVDPLRFADIVPRAADRLRFHPAITDPSADWLGATGFIHEVAAGHAERLTPETQIFVAGPPMMIRATIEMLQTRGIERDRIHFDSFY